MDSNPIVCISQKDPALRNAKLTFLTSQAHSSGWSSYVVASSEFAGDAPNVEKKVAVGIAEADLGT